MLIHHFLIESAKRYPTKPAVIHNNKRLTYSELNTLSDKLAVKLKELGVEKGDRVALLIENSCEYLIAYFGIMKAGAITVAINVQLVPREIQFLISDCTPRVILTDKARSKKVDELSSNAVDGLDKSSPYKNLENAANIPIETKSIEPARSVKPPINFTVDIPFLEPIVEELQADGELKETDLASIIYTSGTTGKPKGVMLSHSNLSANAVSIIEYLKLTDKDSMMVILPFYYSYGNSLLTTHIKTGGTLVLDNRFLYPNVVLESMEKENVTGFAGVPSHFVILLRKSALRNYRLSNLRYVTQAGGGMSPSMIDEFKEILPHTNFFVMYGQTEASARLSYLEPEFLQAKYGSIGKAIPGVELQVFDENGNKTKQGEIGEVVATGENIMQGYWNSPEETKIVLRDGKLFTGDLAKTDEDGFIYLVSRKKDMIKSGANRISPREIEDVVCQMPGILECAVVGVPDEILGEAIKLFVVPVEGSEFTERDVLFFCKENLSLFKMPKQVIKVSTLPKTASGKIKREELKKETYANDL